MFGAAVGVLAHEGYHAKVITVPFQSASSVLIPAGICSVVAGCFKIWATKITDASPPRVRKRSLGVSLSTNEQLFKYMYYWFWHVKPNYFVIFLITTL